MKKIYLLGLSIGLLMPQLSLAYTCKNVPITIHNLTDYQLEVVRVTTAQSDINLKYSDKISPGQSLTARVWPTNGPGEAFADQVSGAVEFDIWKNGHLIGMYKLHYAGSKKSGPGKKGASYCYFPKDRNYTTIHSDDSSLVTYEALGIRNEINFIVGYD